MTLPAGALVVGVGAARGATYAELADTLGAVLDRAGLSRTDVAAVATLTTKRDFPAILRLAESLGAALVALDAAELAAIAVPHPSPAVRSRVGTPSVAEAAALHACGAGADLVIPKTRGAGTPSLCTIAVARRQVGRNDSTNAT